MCFKKSLCRCRYSARLFGPLRSFSLESEMDGLCLQVFILFSKNVLEDLESLHSILCSLNLYKK